MLHYIKHKAELLVYSLKENRTYMRFSEGGGNKEAARTMCWL